MEQCDVVATGLPRPIEMEATTMGPKGIVDRIQPGSTYIDHSINSAELVCTVGSAMANRNVKILDIPLAGGRDGALPGDLTLLAGGDRDAIESL